MKHILVVRGKQGSPAFARSDRFGKQWVKHRLDGQPLRAIIPTIRADLENMNGMSGVTISSCRDASAFVDPDAACIPTGVNVMVVAPMMPDAGRADLNGLRLWAVLHWAGPDREPTVGVKVRQKVVGNWLSEFFTEEQYEFWSRPAGGLRSEIWLRPEWNVAEMFPSLFGATPVVEEVKEEVKPSVSADQPKRAKAKSKR